jgi:hypothetical protein
MADPTSADPAGAAMSAPDAGEMRTYRQHVRAGRRPIQIAVLLELAWFIVGAFVLRQLVVPGPGRLARLILGLVIWIVPLAVIALPVLAGPRRRFRDWWWPRLLVRVDDHGLAWWTEGKRAPAGGRPRVVGGGERPPHVAEPDPTARRGLRARSPGRTGPRAVAVPPRPDRPTRRPAQPLAARRLAARHRGRGPTGSLSASARPRPAGDPPGSRGRPCGVTVSALPRLGAGHA